MDDFDRGDGWLSPSGVWFDNGNNRGPQNHYVSALRVLEYEGVAQRDFEIGDTRRAFWDQNVALALGYLRIDYEDMLKVEEPTNEQWDWVESNMTEWNFIDISSSDLWMDNVREATLWLKEKESRREQTHS